MGYKRLTIYGRNVELYEYDKDFRVVGGRKKKNEDEPVFCGVEESGVTTLRIESERVGKRKDSARRASMAFRRLVLANLGGSENPLLLTLTYRANLQELSHGYRHFTSFIQSLRYRFGSLWRYIAVPEFQQRGAVHFHALIWGLSFEDIGSRVPQTSIENLVKCDFWPHGFVFLKETDGHEKLSSYLVKYMAKAFSAPELRNQKAYVSSRNCSRPVTVGGVGGLEFLIDEYIGKNAKPFEQRVYQTAYLGQCKRSLYYDNPYSDLEKIDLSTVTDEEVFADF